MWHLFVVCVNSVKHQIDRHKNSKDNKQVKNNDLKEVKMKFAEFHWAFQQYYWIIIIIVIVLNPIHKSYVGWKTVTIIFLISIQRECYNYRILGNRHSSYKLSQWCSLNYYSNVQWTLQAKSTSLEGGGSNIIKNRQECFFHIALAWTAIVTDMKIC